MDQGLVQIMIVNLVIWVGIAFYLFSLDRKISRIERENKKRK
ncbi:MAG: CcmD family protein [candidate division KSB1 bacterium]|jgi:CcmD family protein|nr:CcmD family protein [candidate division KSB1 bacterium]